MWAMVEMVVGSLTVVVLDGEVMMPKDGGGCCQ